MCTSQSTDHIRVHFKGGECSIKQHMHRKPTKQDAFWCRHRIHVTIPSSEVGLGSIVMKKNSCQSLKQENVHNTEENTISRNATSVTWNDPVGISQDATPVDNASFTVCIFNIFRSHPVTNLTHYELHTTVAEYHWGAEANEANSCTGNGI